MGKARREPPQEPLAINIAPVRIDGDPRNSRKGKNCRQEQNPTIGSPCPERKAVDSFCVQDTEQVSGRKLEKGEKGERKRKEET